MPNIAERYFNRGRAWFLKGNRDRAVKDFEKAAELAPSYKEKSQDFLIEFNGENPSNASSV